MKNKGIHSTKGILFYHPVLQCLVIKFDNPWTICCMNYWCSTQVSCLKNPFHIFCRDSLIWQLRLWSADFHWANNKSLVVTGFLYFCSMAHALSPPGALCHFIHHFDSDDFFFFCNHTVNTCHHAKKQIENRRERQREK